MVEFGLKLDDNKVSEWSEHYIDYENLKKILKKAKQAQKHFKDLCEKNPGEAERITQLYRSGDVGMVLSPATSTGNLSELESDRTSSSSPHRDFHDGGAAAASTTTTGSLPTLHSGRQLAHKQDEHNTEESNHHNAASTEKTALLEQTSLLDEESSSHWSDKKSYSSTRESIQRTLSNLSDHISRFSHGQSQHRRYERQVKSALKEIDDQTMAFDTLFRNEQKKVVTFYYEKMQELEQRLDNIKESVAQSFGILRHPSDTGGEGGEEGSTEDVVMSLRGGKAVSPFPTHRKHASSMGQKMEEILNRIAAATTTSIGRNASSVGSRNLNGGNHTQLASLFRHPTEHIHLGGMDDDEDFEDDPEMDEKRLAEAESIKRSLVYQYRIAKLLHNYAIMNITGFVKIVKKFDKTVPSEKGRFADALESRNLLNDGKAVDRLAEKYEQQYANWFCDGDIRAAKAQMLTKQGDGLEMDWSQLQLGYRMGMCAVLALWVCWDCVWGLVAEGNSTIGARAAFPVFRACGGLLLLQWFWGCSVFVWTRYRVNYIYLFDLDPRNVSTPIDIFAQAVDNTLMFLVLMLLYYKSGSNDMPAFIPAGGYPLILVALTTLKLIFPLKQRIPMWGIIFKVITAPFNSVTFFQTYIGDIFTSMVKVFQDMAWTICWVLAGDFLVSDDSASPFKNYAHSKWYKNILIPILTQIPLLIRFNQCLRKFHDTGDRFPHLANAAKYALSQMVTLLGTFHPLYLEFTGPDRKHAIPFYQITWTVLFISSSLYSFTWDVYMDWGLGRKKNGFLGPKLMYPRKFYYYATIAVDLVLRFMWVLTLVPPSSGAAFAVPEYLTALSMMLELFRRTIWGFFRLENEHRSNASGYRRVDFVPLHFNTGHQHQYKDKKERSGSSVLTEVFLVTIVVSFFLFASIVAAQHANRATASVTRHEL